MPFHNAFMIRLFETGDFCAGLNTAVNSNRIVTNVSYQDIVAFGNMMLEYKYSSDQNYVLPEKNGKVSDYDAYCFDQSSLKDMIVKK